MRRMWPVLNKARWRDAARACDHACTPAEAGEGGGRGRSGWCMQGGRVAGRVAGWQAGRVAGRQAGWQGGRVAGHKHPAAAAAAAKCCFVVGLIGIAYRIKLFQASVCLRLALTVRYLTGAAICCIALPSCARRSVQTAASQAARPGAATPARLRSCARPAALTAARMPARCGRRPCGSGRRRSRENGLRPRRRWRWLASHAATAAGSQARGDAVRAVACESCP